MTDSGTDARGSTREETTRYKQHHPVPTKMSYNTEGVLARAREASEHVSAGRGPAGLAPSAAPPSADTSTTDRPAVGGSISTLAAEMPLDEDMDYCTDSGDASVTGIVEKTSQHRRTRRDRTSGQRQTQHEVTSDGFLQPPLKKQARPQTIVARELDVSNRYQPLQGEGATLNEATTSLADQQQRPAAQQRAGEEAPPPMDDQQPPSQDSSQAPSTAPHRKVPPIVLRFKESYKQLHTWLKTHCKQPFTVKQAGGGTLKLQLSSTEDCTLTVDELGRTGIAMYTFPAVRPPVLKTLVKGIPMSLSHVDVKEELRDLGFAASLVQHHRMPGTNQHTGHRVVILPDIPGHRDIFKLNRFYDLSITIERLRRTRGPVQCYRCQGFHHVARLCTMDWVCVKCGGPHDSRTCTKAKEQPPTCGLCGGPHPANFRSCAKHKEGSRRNVVCRLFHLRRIFTVVDAASSCHLRHRLHNPPLHRLGLHSWIAAQPR
ncbi:uncharacterized protein LOC126355564 [Schistocerca gregaria]|uniref:uncharacterized protein LOC126355564 n=1 Tax=Schistocerca gregaria TaxID=7010 RepID=UPI00211E8A0A|nr:uncharacterized protein LOC126355564 [Schistocerca gregaria]